jgi:formate/nitrite transporter FocA (FNT family)
VDKLSDGGKSDGAKSADAEEERAREDLEADEVEQAVERSAPPAAVVYEAVRREGHAELRRPVSALAWSSLAAGLSMGFSALTQALLMAYLPDAEWTPLITKFGYSIGFLIVILGRQQLFTENTLTAILPLVREKTLENLRRVGRLWSVVLVGNLIGAALFAWVVSGTTLFTPGVREAMSELGSAAMEADFVLTLVGGIFAGWLIALIVWVMPFAETARVTVIVIITYVIGLGHFPHIVAGSVETLYSVMTGGATLLESGTGYLVPTLLGNIIGGVSLVAAINPAQVVSGEDEKIRERASTAPDPRA